MRSRPSASSASCCFATIAHHVSLGPFLDQVRSGAFGARRIVNPALSRDFHLAYRRDLPEDVLEFILNSVRAIIARRLLDRDLGWRRPRALRAPTLPSGE